MLRLVTFVFAAAVVVMLTMPVATRVARQRLLLRRNEGNPVGAPSNEAPRTDGP